MKKTQISEMDLNEIEYLMNNFHELYHNNDKVSFNEYFYRDVKGEPNGTIIEQIKCRYLQLIRDEKLNNLLNK